MVRIRGVCKTYRTRQGPHAVLNEVDLDVPRGAKIGILGRNGAGKSTLIRLVSGAELPTSGTVRREMSVSWPLAFGDAFQGSLTGLDNLKFICRVYGVPYRERIDFVEDFAELGRFLREPIRTYSAGMRSRLAFAISMAIEFDCFLIDEVVAVGDSRFHKKCQTELFEKRRDRAMLIVSHQSTFIREHCDRAAVLSNTRLYSYDNLSDAFKHYESA